MQAGRAIQTALRLQTLDADLAATGVCMDGSPGGVYHAPAGSAANASRLVVHLEGGGECRSARACAAWAFRSGSSTRWPALHVLPESLPNAWPGSPMDPSAAANPDFHDWAKAFVPYCSGDLHSGTRTERSAALGGFYFAGHRLLAASLVQLRRLWPGYAPSHVLVTGSSAGGIGAIAHADFFADFWPGAVVKVSPEAGLFYPPVASVRDHGARRPTPPAATGMHAEWAPFTPRECAAANNGSAALCSNAHVLLRHLRTPLFIRENLFDVAKLANCGLARSAAMREPASLDYLRTWGQQTRASLDRLRADPRHGFFAPSCLAHASNLRFGSAPRVGGTRLVDAMRAWFFNADGGPLQYSADSCPDGLPCTNSTSPESCLRLEDVRECRALCRLNRRKRRLRLGLDPHAGGHGVCDVREADGPEPDGDTFWAREASLPARRRKAWRARRGRKGRMAERAERRRRE